MHSLIRPIALLLGAAALSGCATGQRGSLTARFIRPGTPAVDLGGPPVAAADSLQVQMAKARHLASRATLRQSTSGLLVESTDQQLAFALLVETALPSATSHFRVAEEYLRLGILDAAYVRLNRALEKDSRLAPAHEALARVWRDWGLPSLGVGAAHRAVHHDPRSASAQNTLGTVLDAMGKLDEARVAYSRALALEPRAAWALNNLCYLELRLKHLDRARAHCEEALRIEPGFAAAHNNLGLTFAAAGDLQQARREFRAAGDAAAADYNLGIVRLAQGDEAAAAAHFEEALKARPTFTAAKQRAHQARLRALTGSN